MHTPEYVRNPYMEQLALYLPALMLHTLPLSYQVHAVQTLPALPHPDSISICSSVLHRDVLLPTFCQDCFQSCIVQSSPE